MDRCNYNGCVENARFLIAAFAMHLKVCGGCIEQAMHDEGVVCATIIDLRRVS